MSKSRLLLSLFLILCTFTIIILIPSLTNRPFENSRDFDGDRALRDVMIQVSFGPRIPGSQAHQKTINWIKDQVNRNGWKVDIQKTEISGHPVQNIVAVRNGIGPWIIIGTHYDTRQIADHDPDPAKRNQPVPGANDGASGVALLLELSRKIPSNLSKKIELVFFDAEDQGDINGSDWILGSRAFVNQLEGKPNAVIIVDMIGDASLNIYRERNSDPNLTDQIWSTARRLNFTSQFLNEIRYQLLDDHIPFVEKGIPSLDIIDFDYPYWHTTEDTLDKVSSQSLIIVGKTLLAWLSNP